MYITSVRGVTQKERYFSLWIIWRGINPEFRFLIWFLVAPFKGTCPHSKETILLVLWLIVGTPVLSWLGVVAQSCSTPNQYWAPPAQDWGTPPPPKARTGVPPPLGKDLWPETWERTWDWGYPPPPPQVNRQTPVKTSPSPSFGCGR